MEKSKHMVAFLIFTQMTCKFYTISHKFKPGIKIIYKRVNIIFNKDFITNIMGISSFKT